jgi:hypothetical protein
VQLAMAPFFNELVDNYDAEFEGLHELENAREETESTIDVDDTSASSYWSFVSDDDSDDDSFMECEELSDGGKLVFTNGLKIFLRGTHTSLLRQPSSPVLPVRPGASISTEVSPLEKLTAILESRGTPYQPVPYISMRDSFVRVTDEMIEAYDAELMGAVHQNDIEKIQELHRAGHLLQCCNRFGESIVHTVARRGHFEILYFLAQHQVSMRVLCDNGRTPLHDACWTTAPNFKAITFLIRECPDFLFTADNRSLTPLSYVPREVWGMWLVYLDSLFT